MSVFIPRGKTITDFVFVLVSAVLTFDGGDGQKFLGLFFGFTFLLGSLALLGHSLWQGNGLVVQGSQQNFLLELSSYASANFGPLAGIDGKTLCLRFRYKKSEHDALNGKPHRPYFRSFRLSPGLPVAIDGVKLRIDA